MLMWIKRLKWWSYRESVVVKTSEAARKHREEWGDIHSRLVDNEKASGGGFYIVGDYEYLRKEFFPNHKVTHSIEGVIEYSDPSAKSKRWEKVVTFNDRQYIEAYFGNSLNALGSTTRIEEWSLVNPDNEELHAMVMIDARGDCGIVAERVPVEDDDELDPETEEWLKEILKEMEEEGKKMDIEDFNNGFEIVGRVEDMISNTFDPFDF